MPPETVGLWPWLAALALASIHVAAHRLDLMRHVPRSRALSASGGAGAAYAVLHLLPEVALLQEDLGTRFVSHAAWLAVLVGLIAFYGLETLLCRHRDEDAAPIGVYALHVGVFVLYNGTIGYLVWGQDELAVFTVAVGLHMLVTDGLLAEAHPRLHQHVGRWVVAGAVLAGAIVGRISASHTLAADVLLAFLAGGILLNVLKEELPSSRRSRFVAFLAGVAAMTVLLFVT